MRDEFDENWNYDYIRLAWDSGFCFTNQKASALIDLSSLSLVDIERTISERDIGTVEKHISTIINYNLDEDQTRILDGTFVKVFKLGQLSIQYLLFCKKYLDHTVTLLKKDINKTHEENKNLSEENEQQKEDIFNLQQKINEQLLHDSHQIALETSYKCNICSKQFSTEEFLAGHVKRRHENSSIIIQTEADKLQLEIKELKERLNCTEKYIQIEPNNSNTDIKSQINNEIKEKDTRYLEIQGEVEKLKLQLENQIKIVEEQKTYQDKYEKWMEMAFKKFEDKQMEIIENKMNKFDKKNMWTQTSDNRTTETQCEEVIVTQKENVNNKEQLDKLKAEFIKIQEEIELDAKSRFEKLEGFLEEKVSDKFEKFSKQMDTFWKTLEETQMKCVERNQHVPEFDGDTPKRDLKFYNKHSAIPVREEHYEIKLSDDESQLENLKRNRINSPLRANPPLRTSPLPKPRPRKSVSTTKILDKPATKLLSKNTTKAVDDTIKTKVLKKDAAKTSNKGVNMHDYIQSKPVKDIYPAITVIQAGKPNESYDTSTDMESDLSKLEMLPTTKPSYTSTLGKRSITSLKRAVFDDDVTSGLSKELEEIVAIRLKNMGISPEWKRLPDESFAKAMSIIKQQAHQSNKKLSKFNKIKRGILKEMERKVISKSTENLTTPTKTEKEIQLRKTTKSTSLKHVMYDSSEDTSSHVNVIFAGKSVNNNKEVDGLEKVVKQDMPLDRLRIHKGNGEHEDVKSITPRSVNETNISGEGFKENPKLNVKKKVFFDLESSNSKNSTEMEIEEKKFYEKPIYFDELKEVISLKANEGNRSDIDSLTVEEKIEIKDPDASDWDISDIMN